MSTLTLHYPDDAGLAAGYRRRRGHPTQGGRASMNARSRSAVRPFASLAAVLAGGLALAGCALPDDLFCDDPGCGFSDEDWARVSALGGLQAAPPDPTDVVFNDAAAQKLGSAFYFDPRFSGAATQVDALGRASAVPRAPKGQALNISCSTCHDLGRAGVDVTSTPGNVSSGAGWTDVNALSTVNSAYQHLFFWNGRADSLWGLSVVVAESPTTMNGNRLHTAWVIADNYRAQFEALFKKPLPVQGDTVCSVSPLLETAGARAGQCKLVNGGCQFPCAAGQNPDPKFISPEHPDSGCWPRFPLQGKPGSKPLCQAGDPTEPFGDAFDCMAADDQKAVTEVLVKWAKALEAFEYVLSDGASKKTPLDNWVAAGPRVSYVDEAARRGAQLFVGKAACVDCHNTPLLSDGAFHDIGVAQVGPDVPTLADCIEGSAACDCVKGVKCLPWGEYDGLTRLAGDPALGIVGSKFLRTGIWSDDAADLSRDADVHAMPTAAMKGAWRTPSLRNVALTGPYMHDGRYATLAEVVDHYNRGGDVAAVGTRAVELRPLFLTAGEQADLVAFLGTMTEPALPVAVSTSPMLPVTPVCP